MHKLGKRQLGIELEKPVTAIPAALSAWKLDLSTDGYFLSYTYDPLKAQTGIAELLQALSKAKLLLRDVNTSQSSLEEIFINLVNTK